EQTTTITGCVKAGTDGRSFTLETEGAESGSAAGQSQSGATPGQSSSSAQRSSGMSGDSKTWSLMASSGDVDLSKYVGQKVQITGRADTSSQSGASSSTSSAAGAHPRFHVQSVRVLSQTCS